MRCLCSTCESDAVLADMMRYGMLGAEHGFADFQRLAIPFYAPAPVVTYAPSYPSAPAVSYPPSYPQAQPCNCAPPAQQQTYVPQQDIQMQKLRSQQSKPASYASAELQKQ